MCKSSTADTGYAPEEALGNNAHQNVDAQKLQNASGPTSRRLKLQNDHSSIPVASNEALSFTKGHQRRRGIRKHRWSHNLQPNTDPVKRLRTAGTRKNRQVLFSVDCEDNVEEDDYEMLLLDEAFRLD